APKKPFTLNVEAPKTTKAGQKNQFRIVLLPAAGYHVNDDKEFPFEVELSAPAAMLPKPKLERADAKVFSKEQARFEVDFTAPKRGPADLEAKIYLAVCRETECIPSHETLAWRTVVENETR